MKTKKLLLGDEVHGMSQRGVDVPPISPEQLQSILKQLDIEDINCATIHQIHALASALEAISGEKFVHLELGNPGISAEHIGIESQCQALPQGVANTYPTEYGTVDLRGKSLTERARLLISIAHPDAREVLELAAVEHFGFAFLRGY